MKSKEGIKHGIPCGCDPEEAEKIQELGDELLLGLENRGLILDVLKHLIKFEFDGFTEWSFQAFLDQRKKPLGRYCFKRGKDICSCATAIGKCETRERRMNPTKRRSMCG